APHELAVIDADDGEHVGDVGDGRLAHADARHVGRFDQADLGNFPAVEVESGFQVSRGDPAGGTAADDQDSTGFDQGFFLRCLLQPACAGAYFTPTPASIGAFACFA